MHCGQTVGQIKMKLGMQLGLGPGHIVLDGDPAALPQRAQPPIFGPYLLRPNGCMDQDATSYGARPLCVRWGPRSPSPKRGQSPTHNFWPMFIGPNGWIDQGGTGRGGRRLCVRWGPTKLPPPQKGVRAPLPNFRPMTVVAKLLDGSRWHSA